MHKKFLVLLTGSIALSISAVPVLASDPPTDDGQYIWQDKNGDYWYRNGSEDEYIGEGNYAPDPDVYKRQGIILIEYLLHQIEYSKNVLAAMYKNNAAPLIVGIKIPVFSQTYQTDIFSQLWCLW